MVHVPHDDGIVRKHLVRKVTVTERAEPERRDCKTILQSTDDPWAGWNDWARAHVDNGIEAEREYWREVLARMLARLEDQFDVVEKKIDALERSLKRLRERSKPMPTIDTRALDQKRQAH